MSEDPVLNKIINEQGQAYTFRQQLIYKIQEKLNSKLIMYISNPGHPWGMITRDDYQCFEELLRTAEGNESVSLVINSTGGDPNAAEKIIHMIRSHFNEFCVIIPNYAKSAATMIALGSDKVYMSHLSELGPIDPQIQILTPEGKQETIPARAIVNGLEDIREKVREGGPIELYLPLLSKLRPEIVRICEESLDEAEEFAKNWLASYMLQGDLSKSGEIAGLLTRGERYKSHGKVINYQEARETLNLNVEILEESIWDLVWELYLRGEQFLRSTEQTKLFENEKVSMALKVGVKRQEGQ